MSERLIEELSALVEEGRNALEKHGWNGTELYSWPGDDFCFRWRTRALGLVRELCGEGSDHYRDLRRFADGTTTSSVGQFFPAWLGIVQAAAQDVQRDESPFPRAEIEDDTMAKGRDRRVAGTASRADVSLVVSGSEANAAIAKQIAAGEELLRGLPPDATAFAALVEKKRIWHDFNVDLLGRLFSTTDEAEKYKRTPTRGSMAPGQSISDRTHTLHNNIRSYIGSLRSVQNRLTLFPEVRKTSEPGPGDSGSPASPGRVVGREVFIVHGRNDAVKESVARFLESLNLYPIILHEKPNLGRTLIEKFEAHSDVAYAVILLTGDDLGGERTKIEACLEKSGDADSGRHTVRAAVEPRSRQNVVLEFGYFIGRLGRRRVCALYEQGVELPSDLDGLAYVSLDGAGAWKLLLAREMKAAGIDLDLNRVM